jgi:beta-glucosidase
MKMKSFSPFWIGLLVVGLAACAMQANTQQSQNVDPEIEAIIKKMTVREKIGQMTQLNLDVVCEGGIYNLVEPHHIDSAKLHKAIVEYSVGSILNCGGHAYPRQQWLEIIGTIQRISTTKTTHKIPVLYGIDAIHGANYVMGSTLFPQPLAQAATFDRQLIEQGARITAYETRAVGIPWNFSPVLDVARNPLWSRVFETYGEEPLVCAELGSAAIRGYQDSNDSTRVAACMKHFLGYSAARTGKDRTPSYIPNNMLREIYLPSFQKAIDNRALTVMINSGEINGQAVHASKEILTDLLRNELKFEGLAVTDWEDIMKLQSNHRVAATLKEATKMAIDAGIDMCMVPNDYNFSDLLLELVTEGAITEERLNVSVRRILMVKKKMGLFKDDLVPSLSEYPNFGSAAFAQKARVAAEQSITLLENRNQTLPLNTSQKVLVTGPAANSMILLNGSWTRTWQGVDPQWDNTAMHTIWEAMNQASSNVTYAEGCGISNLTDVDNAMQMAGKSDVIVACMGEWPSTEKPGDIDDLNLEAAQLQYVEKLLQIGKPVVLVLVENRPRLINQIADRCAAVVMAYQPGDWGGDALSNVLYGEVSPSGRLPLTYPRFNHSLFTYDHKYTETLDQKFGNTAYNPQWEFGRGLTYANLIYSNLRVEKSVDQKGDYWQVSVEIENKSNYTVNESTLLFVRDLYATTTPHAKKLKNFAKTNISPKTKETVIFKLHQHDLMFVDYSGQLKWEGGEFEFMIEGLKQTVVIP